MVYNAVAVAEIFRIFGETLRHVSFLHIKTSFKEALQTGPYFCQNEIERRNGQRSLYSLTRYTVLFVSIIVSF